MKSTKQSLKEASFRRFQAAEKLVDKFTLMIEKRNRERSSAAMKRITRIRSRKRKLDKLIRAADRFLVFSEGNPVLAK